MKKINGLINKKPIIIKKLTLDKIEGMCEIKLRTDYIYNISFYLKDMITIESLIKISNFKLENETYTFSADFINLNGVYREFLKEFLNNKSTISA